MFPGLPLIPTSPHKKPCLKVFSLLPVDPHRVPDAETEPGLPYHKTGIHLGQGDTGKEKPELLLLKMQVPEVGFLW